MRIIILTHDNDRHYYFCNQIIENKNNVVGVITGGKHIYKTITKREKFYKLIKSNELLNSFKNRFLNLCFKKYGKAFHKEKEVAENHFFNGAEKHFFQNYNHLLITKVKPQHRSINDPYYVSLIQEQKPDIIIVMGTCLIGKEIIESAKHVINLHTGLSPYYRGGATNAWPIDEEDSNMFGVTVHEMSLGIDSGNIIFTNQPEINKNDNYGTINCKCIQLGTKKVIESIKNIEKNSLHSIKQWTSGKLFFNKDWNNYVAYQYFKKKKRVILQSLKNIEKQSLPKICLINNGIKCDV